MYPFVTAYQYPLDRYLVVQLLGCRVVLFLLLIKRERSRFNLLINIELLYATRWIQHSRKTRIFLKDNLELIVIIINTFIQLWCASLNFVLINRLRKSYCFFFNMKFIVKLVSIQHPVLVPTGTLLNTPGETLGAEQQLGIS